MSLQNPSTLKLIAAVVTIVFGAGGAWALRQHDIERLEHKTDINEARIERIEQTLSGAASDIREIQTDTRWIKDYLQKQ